MMHFMYNSLKTRFISQGFNKAQNSFLERGIRNIFKKRDENIGLQIVKCNHAFFSTSVGRRDSGWP